MSTKTVTRSSATFSRVPTSGWFTLGKSSGGTNQNAQITFPALGIAGVINSVKLYIPWNCTTAGEGFSAAGAMVATVGGVPYNFSMSGMSGTAVVTLSSGGWSNSVAFVVDLRGQSGAASSTSKGCDQDVYLSVDYISEPAPTPPPVYTPGTVTGGTINVDWGDGSDTRGIFAPSQLMYEIQVSLDGGGSWGTLYDTQPGVSYIGFNFASYVGYSQGNDYYNGSVLFRVRTRTPDFNGTVYRSDWATSGTFAIDYRYSSGAPGVATPGTVSGDAVTFDWADVGSQNGVYGASGMSYELVISLDGGASWGGILGTGVGTSQLTVNLRSYIGVPAGRYYLNASCRFAVRSVSPNGHRSGWGYSNNFAVDYRVAPSQPAAPTLSKANPYEGETITVTVDRPAAYNTQDAGGATNQLTYIVWSDTTEVVRGTAPCTQGSISLTLGIGQWTTGRDDLATGLTVLVRDSMSLDSPWSARTALTVRRYRAPVAVVTTIPRTATTATINLAVSDTGYGGTQASNQVRSIQYKLGSGNWTAATLGTWNGLANSFALSGLTAGSRYALQIKAFNAGPGGTGLADKEGAAYAATVLEFSPALFPWYDTATGGSGTATKALVVGDDYGVPVAPGDIVAKGLSLTKDALRLNMNRPSGGTNRYSGFTFQDNGTGTNGLYYDYTSNDFYFGVNADKRIWHSGNFIPGNYLPLTGGTLTGDLNARVVTGSRFATGWDSGVSGSMSCSGWFRSQGVSGWYNDTYGGGIYMTDNSNVRVYNNKNFWVDAAITSNTSTPLINLSYSPQPDIYNGDIRLTADGNGATRMAFRVKGYPGQESTPLSLYSEGKSVFAKPPRYGVETLYSNDLNTYQGAEYGGFKAFFWWPPNQPSGSSYGFLECLYFNGTGFNPGYGQALVTLQRFTSWDGARTWTRSCIQDNRGYTWTAWTALN